MCIFQLEILVQLNEANKVISFVPPRLSLIADICHGNYILLLLYTAPFATVVLDLMQDL